METNNNAPARVIITSARSIMALVIANSLGKKDIELIGTDCVDVTMLSFSKYVHKHDKYANYLFHPEQFLDDLEGIIKKNIPDDNRPYVLMPVFKESILIAKNKERFEQYITVACPSEKAINSIHPKQNFAITAKKLDIKVPETHIPVNKDELNNLKNSLKFPVLIKPYNESGGKGIKKINDFNMLKTSFNENIKVFHDPPLIQELIDGSDYCLTTLFKNGTLLTSMAYKNLHRFPAKSGSGIIRETIDEKPFVDEAVKLFGPLKWNGVAQIDFLWDGNYAHKPYMIEVNPRFWAGLFQSVYSGIDYPWLNYLLFTNQEIPEIKEAMKGEKTKIPVAWMLSAVEESIQIDQSINDIEKTGHLAMQELLQNNNLINAFKIFFNHVNNHVQSPVNFGTFKAALQDSRNAENEILTKEDPTAAMGIIYSVLYWVKYKKLPPEIGL